MKFADTSFILALLNPMTAILSKPDFAY